MPTPRKKLRARNPVVKKKGPLCPVHELLMHYSAEEGLWTCAETGCTQVSFPRSEASKGKPIVGRGDVEVFVMTDGHTGEDHYFLRATDNNVMIDLTGVAVVGLRPEGATLNAHTVPYTDAR